MDPLIIIVIESWCESIPFNEWLLAEELVGLIPDCFNGSCWEWQLHVSLKWDLAHLLALSGVFYTLFSMSSWLGVLSTSSVPKVSASHLPPFMTRSPQCPLTFASPPRCLWKSNSMCMGFSINMDQISNHGMHTQPNAEIENWAIHSNCFMELVGLE